MFSSIVIDGQICNSEYLKISIGSNTIRYGISIFEAPKIFFTPNKAYLYRFNLYYERLCRSCRLLDIEFPFTMRELVNQISLLKNINNNFNEMGIRINVLNIQRGELLEKVVPNVVVSLLDLSKRNDSNLEAKKIRIADYRRSKNANIYAIKSPSNYEISRYELIKDVSYDDVLFINNHDEICELSRSNIFFIKNNSIYTPPLSAGILDGVTRRTVIEICKENGLEINIEDISLDRISTFDGCFCVGTTTGILPIKRIEEEVYETKLDLMNRLIFLYKSLFSEKNMYENRKDFVEI